LIFWFLPVVEGELLAAVGQVDIERRKELRGVLLAQQKVL